MAVYHDERLEPSDYRWIRWFRIDQFESERCLTSHFVSSKTLFWLRLPMVLYTTIVIWADIIWCIVIGEFRHFFAYFTHFTFIGLHAYLLVILSRSSPRSLLPMCKKGDNRCILTSLHIMTDSMLPSRKIFALLSSTPSDVLFRSTCDP